MQLRLQALAALLGMTLLPAHAVADGRAAAWLEVYDDDDNLNVISSQLSARGDAIKDVEVSASYEVDVISAATADVVTAASPRGYEENRHGLSFAATWELEAGTTLQARYLPSWEIDYRSQGFVIGFSREWLDRRLTTALTTRLTLDQVGRSGSGDTAFKDVRTIAAGLKVGWIASAHTLIHATYEPQQHKGFQASPYRFVDIEWQDGTTASVPEAVPDRRFRHAFAMGARHALSDEWFLSGSYRLYLDSWGIVSHTGEAELQRAIDWDEIVIGLGLRGYQQGAADFQQNDYTTMTGFIPAHRSADKMLARSWSVLGGIRAELALGDLLFLESLRLTLKFELYNQRFQDFAPLKNRLAQTAALGASSEF